MMKVDDIFSDKSDLIKNHNIYSQNIRDMNMEEMIPLMLFTYIFGDIFLNEEIKNEILSTKKMTLLSESEGSICIDTSKMEYVEVDSESNHK